MTASLSLSETATELTYTGIDGMAGVQIVVQKDAGTLDVRQVVPADLTTQTWEDLRDDLSTRLT